MYVKHFRAWVIETFLIAEGLSIGQIEEVFCSKITSRKNRKSKKHTLTLEQEIKARSEAICYNPNFLIRKLQESRLSQMPINVQVKSIIIEIEESLYKKISRYYCNH